MGLRTLPFFKTRKGWHVAGTGYEDSGGGGGGGYTLPVASADTLGGVKVGNNLSIDNDGVLSATGGSGGGGSVVVQDISLPSSASIEPSDMTSFSINVAKQGYTPIGVVGFNFKNTSGTNVFTVTLTKCVFNSNTLDIYAFNISPQYNAVLGTDSTIRILYKPN